MPHDAFSFSLNSLRFDEHYTPSQKTRLTTNFANLARGANRQENLKNTICMINNRFNALANWDNPNQDRYHIDLDIISVEVKLTDEIDAPYFPIIEILKSTITDKKTQKIIDGISGNSLSSYVRDYDFSILLPKHNQNKNQFETPKDFGVLHGNLFNHFLHSDTYQNQFSKPPIICLSVSSSRQYHCTENHHPILGTEYRQDSFSSTDEYFQKMGLTVRYFMPTGSVAPMAFYYTGDLLNDYSNLELISTISIMETFQKIYRPEIYNANFTAGKIYQPSLHNQDHCLTQIVYDREERSKLAVQQGKFIEETFIKPHHELLEQWSNQYSHHQY